MVIKMELKVTGNLLELLSHQRVTSESVGVIEARFNFDSAWDGYTPSAVFKTQSTICSVALDKGGCTIPGEVLANPGTLSVAVFGIGGDGSVLTTNYINSGMIIKGADIAAAAEKGYTTSPYEQILAMLSEIAELLEVI